MGVLTGALCSSKLYVGIVSGFHSEGEFGTVSRLHILPK